MSSAIKAEHRGFAPRTTGLIGLALVIVLMGLVAILARGLKPASSHPQRDDRWQLDDIKSGKSDGLYLYEVPKDFLPVPLVRQLTEHSCGPAALLSVTKYWQVFDDSEHVLYPLLDTTREFGTTPQKIVEVAKEFGLKASMKQGLELEDLATALERGETVIVNFQAWGSNETDEVPWKEEWEDGHYAVLIGLDGNHAYLMDPWVGYGYLPLTELVDRWHDYTDRSGKREEFRHMGILIQGRTPVAEGLSPPLVRIK